MGERKKKAVRDICAYAHTACFENWICSDSAESFRRMLLILRSSKRVQSLASLVNWQETRPSRVLTFGSRCSGAARSSQKSAAAAMGVLRRSASVRGELRVASCALKLVPFPSPTKSQNLTVCLEHYHSRSRIDHHHHHHHRNRLDRSSRLILQFSVDFWHHIAVQSVCIFAPPEPRMWIFGDAKFALSLSEVRHSAARRANKVAWISSTWISFAQLSV